VLLESWGGDVPSAEISALKKQGIEHLLELILLVADLQELTASARARRRGVVLEARREAGRGNVATVLVQSGDAEVGDVFFAARSFGRVRSMHDDRAASSRRGPATPVEVTGFEELPQAGDPFQVVEDEAKAGRSSPSASERTREKAMPPPASSRSISSSRRSRKGGSRSCRSS
jgi:translation initiation factor IF-2